MFRAECRHLTAITLARDTGIEAVACQLAASLATGFFGSGLLRGEQYSQLREHRAGLHLRCSDGAPAGFERL